MDEIRIEKLARAMALADSREMILATSDASELHHVSDSGWKDYRHMAIAALAEDAALSPPEGQVPAECSRAMFDAFTAELRAIEIGYDALCRGYKAMRRAMPLQDHGWQDISTAPKDGTVVLIGSTNSKGKFFVADAMWDRAWGGWMLFHPDHDSYSAECHQVSHWQPLPAPPAILAEEQTEAK